jgi:hypothetical protein
MRLQSHLHIHFERVVPLCVEHYRPVRRLLQVEQQFHDLGE